ncbi:unnamed protein product [Urochloa humidicola]
MWGGDDRQEGDAEVGQSRSAAGKARPGNAMPTAAKKAAASNAGLDLAWILPGDRAAELIRRRLILPGEEQEEGDQRQPADDNQQERENYEYIINDGKIIHKLSGEPLDTSQGPKGTKWIFVMSTAKRLYAGKKERGVFQHSSFLAGGTTIAAGRFTAENGIIKSIWAYSGHYKPSAENLSNFMNFLEENGVDLKEVEVRVHPPKKTTMKIRYLMVHRTFLLTSRVQFLQK